MSLRRNGNCIFTKSCKTLHFIENHWMFEIKNRKCKYSKKARRSLFSSISNSKDTIKKSNKFWDFDGSENYQLLLGLKIQLSNLWMAKQAAIYNHLLLCFQSHCITSTNLKVKYKIKIPQSGDMSPPFLYLSKSVSEDGKTLSWAVTKYRVEVGWAVTK